MLLLLILFCLSCVGLVGWGFTGWNRCLRFASLMGASMAGFVLPQVIGEYNSGRILHTFDGGLEMFMIMCLLLHGGGSGRRHLGISPATEETFGPRPVTTGGE